MNIKQVPLFVGIKNVSCSWYNHEQLLRLKTKTHEQGVQMSAKADFLEKYRKGENN